ncbi:MAG: glycosyltransferase, partial [Actinomycetota bacterium]
MRAWRIDDPGFDTEVVIGRTGPLAPEYAALSELRTAGLDRRSPEQLVARGFDAVGLAHLGRRVRAAATRVRVGDRPADLVVVNGATAAGVELLRTTPQAPTVLIAHELSTGWMSNIDADDRGLLLSSSQGFLAVSHAVEDFLVEQLGVAQEIITVVPPP